jgi:hypothetical protein
MDRRGGRLNYVVSSSERLSGIMRFSERVARHDDTTKGRRKETRSPP